MEPESDITSYAEPTATADVPIPSQRSPEENQKISDTTAVESATSLELVDAQTVPTSSSVEPTDVWQDRPTTSVPVRVYTIEDRLRAKEKKRAQIELMLAGIMTYATDKRNSLVSAGVVSTGYEGAEDGDTLDAVLGISNDEVEAKLGVSDTTAAKYLKELVTRGLLEKRGKGRGVVYRVTEN
jgi:hypothetical protein